MMFSRKKKNLMKVLGAAAVARRFPLLGLAAVAAGGAYAYYKMRGRSGHHDIMSDDQY